VLMETTAEHDVSVIMSSHLVADLERISEYLVVLVESRVQVAGEIDELLASHQLLTGARRDPAAMPANQHVISASHTDRQSTILVRCDEPILDPSWSVDRIDLEDLVLAYMGQARTSRLSLDNKVDTKILEEKR
jgi:ABC-2 type transport system ATP-binding protein